MNRNHNRICTKCHRVFSIDTSKLETCHPCSEAIEIQSRCVPNMTCCICKELFYSPNHLKICPYCSAKPYNQLSRKEKVYTNNNSPKKSGRKIPLEVLDRIEEKKRVFDDKHAEKFIRWGGVRDRI